MYLKTEKLFGYLTITLTEALTTAKYNTYVSV